MPKWNVRYYGSGADEPDEEWLNWDPEELTVQDMLRIEEETGYVRVMGPESVLSSAYLHEAKGAQALVWWLHGGKPNTKHELMDLKPGKLRLELVDDVPLVESSGTSATSTSDGSRSSITGRRSKSTDSPSGT
jgi:hypothetical protein